MNEWHTNLIKVYFYQNKGENRDLNVLEAYKRFGVTGEGVVVTILDDGIEKNHTDLRDNYVRQCYILFFAESIEMMCLK